MCLPFYSPSSCVASGSTSPLLLHNHTGPANRTGVRLSTGHKGVELGQKDARLCDTGVVRHRTQGWRQRVVGVSLVQGELVMRSLTPRNSFPPWGRLSSITTFQRCLEREDAWDIFVFLFFPFDVSSLITGDFCSSGLTFSARAGPVLPW